MKLDFGASARDIRQWKKNKKSKFSPFVQERDKISELLSTKQRQRDEEIKKQNWEAKREREEHVTRERQQQEKEFWEEKFRAELRVAEQKLEMETAAKATHAKLPKLRILHLSRAHHRIGSDLKICLSSKSTVDQFQMKRNLATC